jgi:hypothetical protein
LRAFENRVLRRILRLKTDKMAGGYRKLHKKEILNLYSSPNIIRIIKSRRMKWTGQIARMGRERLHIGFGWESRKERDH